MFSFSVALSVDDYYLRENENKLTIFSFSIHFSIYFFRIKKPILKN